MIFVVRTTAGREESVAERIRLRAKREGLEIYSILCPKEVKGYIFVEAASYDEVRRALYRLRHSKGIVGQVSLDEVKHFIIPPPEPIKINIGDLVEIISGPFAGEKARVTKVNKAKEEVVVELLETVVPIPITLKIDSVRIIKRKE